jgi:hypothetical protein
VNPSQECPIDLFSRLQRKDYAIVPLFLTLQLTESKCLHSALANGHRDAASKELTVCAGGHVNRAFDIFKRLADGRPEWVEAVEGLEEASARMSRLASNSSATYFIYSVVVESQVTREGVPIQMVVFAGAGLP